mmetsp:Transcript_26008/g.56711  ORF Transcript_26008/g.56711 Transcript_26008/m.56711 type:complete len:241 (+) Transcript_26008:968-1690(+)
MVQLMEQLMQQLPRLFSRHRKVLSASRNSSRPWKWMMHGLHPLPCCLHPLMQERALLLHQVLLQLTTLPLAQAQTLRRKQHSTPPVRREHHLSHHQHSNSRLWWSLQQLISRRGCRSKHGETRSQMLLPQIMLRAPACQAPGAAIGRSVQAPPIQRGVQRGIVPVMQMALAAGAGGIGTAIGSGTGTGRGAGVTEIETQAGQTSLTMIVQQLILTPWTMACPCPPLSHPCQRMRVMTALV